MKDDLSQKETIKNYLLGKISDEEMLTKFEEALFSDDKFAEEVELAEDEIINDYVLGNLSAEDFEAAENCFFKNSERRFKLTLTQELKKKAETSLAETKQSFFEMLKYLFRRKRRTRF